VIGAVVRALLEFIFFLLTPTFLNRGSNRDSTGVALTARLPSFFIFA
jgi:hypothetical protein